MKLYIDEAWRWPLAWPMFVGIVLPLKKFDKSIFDDSKKLPEKQRNLLFSKIEKLALDWKIKYSVWIVSAAEIDKFWVTKSLNLAIRRWLYHIFVDDTLNKWITKSDLEKMDLDIKLVIDWNNTFGLDADLGVDVDTVVKWDSKIKEISMASIIAKVSRDRMMVDVFDKKYPKYDFKKHKWYGTKQHVDLIKKFGPCKIHRKLFLRKIFGEI